MMRPKLGLAVQSSKLGLILTGKPRILTSFRFSRGEEVWVFLGTLVFFLGGFFLLFLLPWLLLFGLDWVRLQLVVGTCIALSV